MSLELFIVLLLLAALLFAIIRKLFLIAFIVIVVVFAYYTGLAGAFFDVIFSLLPATGESMEVAQIAIVPLLMA